MAALIDDVAGSVASQVYLSRSGWTRQAIEDVLGGQARFVKFQTPAGTYWLAMLNLGDPAEGYSLNATATLISGHLVTGPALVIPPWEVGKCLSR